MKALNKLSRVIAAIGLLIFAGFQLSKVFIGWPENVSLYKAIGIVLIAIGFILQFVYLYLIKDKKELRNSLLFVGAYIAIFFIYYLTV